MQKKSKYKASDFYQTLSNGNQVFDFEKFEKTPFNMVFIISERGARGKTLNAKEYARKKWESDKRPSIFMYNTIPLITKAMEDFKEDLQKPFVKNELGEHAIKFWEETKIIGDPEKNLAKVTSDGKQFIKLLSTNHAELMKGARLNWKAIFWDEFNVNYHTIRDAISKVTSLLHSSEDVVANSKQDLMFFVFGNNKSLDVDFMYKLGVTHLEHEVTEIWSDDEIPQPIMLIVSPQYNDVQRQEIAEKNKNNFIFNITKQLGEHAHAYFNESLYDDINHIKRYTDTQARANKYLLPSISIHHDGSYYNIYRIKKMPETIANNTFGNLHIVAVDKDKTFHNALYIFNRRDQIEFTSMNVQVRNQVIKFVSKSKITYEDVRSRMLFLRSIK